MLWRQQRQQSATPALAITIPLATVGMPRVTASPAVMSPSPSKKNGANMGAQQSNMAGMGMGGMKNMNSPMTYIPPLCDGACGTTPRSQMPMMEMMYQEMMAMMRMVPTICWAMVMQRRHMSWADMGHMAMQMVLACMEMCMMVAAIPMYMMLPGFMFAVWVCCCGLMCMCMCWMLNGKEQMYQCVTGSESWMMGQESDDEKWMFMGGMGMR